MNKIVQRLRARDRILGIQSFSGSAHIIELLGHAGFEVVMIDTEHAGVDLETTGPLLRAASSSGMASWLRVGKLDSWLIAKALDLGADGVVVPRIQHADQVREAVRAANYPPLGVRGMCPDIRASGYSMEGWLDYAQNLGERITVLPLIEDIEGVRNIREIAAVEGFDALFFGPADFGVSIGAAKEGFTPRIVAETRKALEAVVAAADERGLSVVTTPLTDLLDVDRSLTELENVGVNVFLYSIDTFLLNALSRKIVGSFRNLGKA